MPEPVEARGQSATRRLRLHCAAAGPVRDGQSGEREAQDSQGYSDGEMQAVGFAFDFEWNRSGQAGLQEAGFQKIIEIGFKRCVAVENGDVMARGKIEANRAVFAVLVVILFK